MKTHVFLLAAGSTVLAASTAMAAPPDAAACVDAYTRAQTLRGDRKLLEARDALRICGQPTCKDFIVRDCVSWLDAVQSGLPSIVPVARDPAGNDLANVQVTMDGAPLLGKIDGRSVEVNPGTHAISFLASDGTKIDKDIVVAEGEKGKLIVVQFGASAAPAASAPGEAPAPAPAPVPAPAAPAPAAASPAPAPGAPAPAAAAQPPVVPDAASEGIPLKTIGMITTGAGVLALGAGAVFGTVALGKKNDAHCSSDNVCPSDAAANSIRDAQGAATASTILFVVGGILGAGGVTMWVLGSSGPVHAEPAVGPKTAGLVLEGVW